MKKRERVKLRKNKRDAMCTPTKTVGFGYVGKWRRNDEDQGPGWFLPRFLVGSPYGNELPNPDASMYVSKDGEAFVLCRITVEQVFASDGRAITRRVRRG